MEFLDLSLDARYRIYVQTKKVLRKYQKGIQSGKLTSEQFVSYMLKDVSMISIIQDLDVSIDNFSKSYKEYVDTLILIQNNSLKNNNRYGFFNAEKPNCSSIFKLKNLLEDTGYILCIPYEYLSQNDIDSIEKYVTTGSIDLGNEKIYNYVSKTY